MIVKGMFEDEHGMFITIKFYGTYRLRQGQTVRGVYRMPEYKEGVFETCGFMYVKCHNPKDGQVRKEIEKKVQEMFISLQKDTENHYFYQYFDKKTRKQFQNIAQFKELTAYQLIFD